MKIKKEQTVCEWKKATPDKPNPDSYVGFAINSKNTGIIHGLRHPAKKNISGWYIWFGEYSEADDFFVPICIKHLQNYISQDISEYLELPAGYRFLVDSENYEDVWFDEQLLI